MIDEKVGASVSVAAINGRGNGIAAVCALMMAAALWAALTPAAHAGAYDVTTYHYDAQRTGWNPSETTLDWSNVNSAQFGLLNSIPLDEQVDAQALVVSAATLAAKGIAGYPNDLVYVATENNTIYAIDSVTGVTMFQTHLGTPVSANSLPGQCINNSAVIGITSTPVIDLTNGVMYVIAASVENSAAVYRIHELSIATLVDVVPSVIISASQTLSDGTVTKFWPAFQRQRPGLLLSNGVVYAGFGSYCDLKANLARGWLMGWTTGNLQPLPNVGLTDRQTAAETGNFQGGNFYLSSFWASGYGLAADPEGYIYAQTGNSDTIRSDNLPDSALKIAPGITSLAGYFTPSNFAGLDSEDADLGSGGIMVVPETPGLPHFAVGGGKDGRLFLYNRNNMGGFAANGVDAPASVQAGQCWCGPSYFVGSDGKPRIVSSGGHTPMTWFLPMTTKSPLIHENSAAEFPVSDQDSGFLTTVSSNGTSAGTAIIWAQTRAINSSVSLYALAASAGLPVLFSGISGVLANSQANANIVPLVAGGKVFVPSYKQLDIFGLTPAQARPRPIAAAAATAVEPAVRGPRYFGRIVSLDAGGKMFKLTLRTGLQLQVDAAAAIANHLSVVLYLDETVEVSGAHSLGGAFTATDILRVKQSQDTWGPDIP